MNNYEPHVPTTNVHLYGHNQMNPMNHRNMNNYIGQKRPLHDLFLSSTNNTNTNTNISHPQNVQFCAHHSNNNNNNMSTPFEYPFNNNCNKRQRLDDNVYVYDGYGGHGDPNDCMPYNQYNATTHLCNLPNLQCDADRITPVYSTNLIAHNNNNMLPYPTGNTRRFATDYAVHTNAMNYAHNACAQSTYQQQNNTNNRNINAFNTTSSPISPASSTNSTQFNQNHHRLMPNTAEMAICAATASHYSLHSISPKIEESHQNMYQTPKHNKFDLPPIIDSKFEVEACKNNVNEEQKTQRDNAASSNNVLPAIVDQKISSDYDNSTHCNHFPDFCNIPPAATPSISIPPLSPLNTDSAQLPATAVCPENINNIIFAPITLNISANNKTLVQSASCHQCKTKKDVSILFYCTKKKPCLGNTYKTKVIKCRKKYCMACMTKYFEETDVVQFKKFKDSLSWSFDCPACQNVCSCRACKRKRARNKVKNEKCEKTETTNQQK